MNNDTIFALSSGHGKSGVAVIRISGTELGNTFSKFINKTDFINRHAYFTNLHDTNKDLIDQVICIYFRAPHSFTGEDIIEIHSHGAPAVIEKIFSYLSALGFRMATPGEFSRRAFYNNKMNLADVDGLAALLDAQTDVQRKSALKSMMGGDSKIYDSWRNQMIEISAYAAATLDYSDDELPANIVNTIRTKTKKLHTEIQDSLSRYTAVRAIRSGFNIALVGETNVGKSSLFNAILGANRAIVSDIPGTTRDVVSAAIDMNGYLVNLSDTAGLRKTANKIERIGIQRTKTEIENADLILRVLDGSKETKIPSLLNNELLIINKSDITQGKQIPQAIYVSAKTGKGMDKLIMLIKEKIATLTAGTESSVAINARTRVLLTEALQELKSAMDTSDDNYDIFAEHVHRAADNIGKILGTITASEVMDATFSQLCLGK